jgi:hypothetical protein
MLDDMIQFPGIQIFLWAFSIIAFCINIATVVIAVINFIVILRTGVTHFNLNIFLFTNFLLLKVLHQNLKFVLLVQAFVIAGWSTSQILTIVGSNFARNEFHFMNYPIYATICTIFFGQYFTIIGHVLLIERVLATFVNRYENYRKPYFSVVWFSVLVSL